MTAFRCGWRFNLQSFNCMKRMKTYIREQQFFSKLSFLHSLLDLNHSEAVLFFCLWQTPWLSWFLMWTHLSTSVCSSTVSCWMDSQWMLTHMAASSTQSSPLTLWSQNTPQQKYEVSDASSLHGTGINIYYYTVSSIRKLIDLCLEELIFYFKDVELKCKQVHFKTDVSVFVNYIFKFFLSANLLKSVYLVPTMWQLNLYTVC